MAGADEQLPVSGVDFEPMQSLALGGLGAAWGAASFTYTPDELARIGIRDADFARYYREVAERIGVSGDPEDDASREGFAGVDNHQPPLELDSASEDIWEHYCAHRESFRRRGLSLGRTPLAVLSRDLGDRRANPYFDMDFWSDSRKSVFRPRYLVEALEQRPGFTLERGQLVLRFEDGGDVGVKVHSRALEGGEKRTFHARRVLLCAGAIGSARIALHSLGRFDEPAPILCNPYTYMPCVNWRLLGRPVKDRKHSMSQLTAIYAPADDPADFVSAQLYGYRSLLLFKLVKEIPLPPWAGLLVSRVLANSLVIGGLHHSDSASPDKTLRILPHSGDGPPEVRFDYRTSAEEQRRRDDRERAVARLLRGLGLLPIMRLSPGAASSIHYAGTIPVLDDATHDGRDGRWGTLRTGRLAAARNVYVGDSSSWRHLPAKGLTFTLMANARRVADCVGADLAGVR
jgi:hypothetical protein